MTLTPINILTLIQFSFLAAAVAYVITGTKIAFPVRVVGFHILKWCPLPLSTIFFCPSCNAWWAGSVIALLAGWEWPAVVQLALTSCLLTALLQLRYGFASDDMEKIRHLFKDKGKTNDEETGRPG